MAVVPCLLLTLTLTAPPAPTKPSASYGPGDELVYTGEAVEANTRPDQSFRRVSKVEVRHLVLQVRDGVADVASLTILRPEDDAALARTAVEVAGATKEPTRRAPLVRFELLRVAADGTIARLIPESSPPPLILKPATPTAPLPAMPLDAVNPLEYSALLTPPTGQRWTQTEVSRPEIAWTAQPAVIRDGAEVIELVGVQAHPKWNAPGAADQPWRRTERLWFSPADGLVRVVWRRIEHTHGSLPTLRIETRLALQPRAPMRGPALAAVRREIEYAWWFSQQADELPVDRRPALLARIRRYGQDYPATAFRDAVDDVVCRLTK